jgi:hypothetical protein
MGGQGCSTAGGTQATNAIFENISGRVFDGAILWTPLVELINNTCSTRSYPAYDPGASTTLRYHIPSTSTNFAPDQSTGRQGSLTQKPENGSHAIRNSRPAIQEIRQSFNILVLTTKCLLHQLMAIWS